jgi:hypothetical protein
LEHHLNRTNCMASVGGMRFASRRNSDIGS